jgi:hypothetical protein
VAIDVPAIAVRFFWTMVGWRRPRIAAADCWFWVVLCCLILRSGLVARMVRRNLTLTADSDVAYTWTVAVDEGGRRFRP